MNKTLEISAMQYDFHTLLKVSDICGLTGEIGFHDTDTGYLISFPDDDGKADQRMVEYNLEIGKRIRQQRKAHGLTREEFAENLSTTMQYISRLERAKNKVSIEYLYRIADALDCSIYTLLPATQLPQRKFFSEELMYQLDHCSLKQKQFIANYVTWFLQQDIGGESDT